MAARIRGQEVTLQVIVDGDQKGGSFMKVENFELSPRSELVDTDFLGEKESEQDVNHHGFDFTFSTHESDEKPFDLMQQIVAAEQKAIPYPAINVVVIYKYRDPSVPSRVMVLENCRLKLDKHEVSGRKDFVKNMWSGKCKTISKL